MIHWNPEVSRIATAQLFSVDSQGELDFHSHLFMDNEGPLTQLEAVSVNCDPRVTLVRAYESELLYFGGKKGFEIVGRHFTKFFFRVGHAQNESVFCATDTLLEGEGANPSIRAHIDFIQPGELEQFGLGELRRL